MIAAEVSMLANYMRDRRRASNPRNHILGPLHLPLRELYVHACFTQKHTEPAILHRQVAGKKGYSSRLKSLQQYQSIVL